jgi:hypothetical protein
MPPILYDWFGSKDLPTVGPPNCEEKKEECTSKCEAEKSKCVSNAAVATTSGGRRKKSLKKGGRKSRKSRSYRSTSRGSKSRRSKSRA